MSRIGNRNLTVPTGVEVTVEGQIVKVKGPKGELTSDVSNYVTVEVTDGKVITKRINDTKPAKQIFL